MKEDDGAPKKSGDAKGSPSGSNVIWYLLVAGAVAMALAVIVVRNSAHKIRYSDFLRLVEASRLDEQVLGELERMVRNRGHFPTEQGCYALGCRVRPARGLGRSLVLRLTEE